MNHMEPARRKEIRSGQNEFKQSKLGFLVYRINLVYGVRALKEL